MQHTKTKTFIAFINRTKKDSYWIDGNYLFEQDSPKIYAYETREDKDIANIVGYRQTQWDEIEQTGGEVVGVILKVTDEMVSTISKEKAIELEHKIYGNTIYKSAPIKKEKKEKVSEPVVEKVIEKIPEKIVETKLESKPETISEEPKKRGRPKKLVVVD